MRRSALALLLGCLLLVAGASALDGYDYYQTIEYAACDQEIYQQDLVIHRSTGTAYEEAVGPLRIWHIYVGDHCREDYGDIRFTNSTGELAYYLWPDYDATSARFAVRLEGADAAGVTQIHYGNPTATTTSDGDAVYIFFDHFDGTAVDSAKWTQYRNTISVSDGSAVFISRTTNKARVRSNVRVGPGVIIEQRLRLTSTDPGVFHFMEIAQDPDPDLVGTDAYWNYGRTDFTTDTKNMASNSAWTATRYPQYADWRTSKTYRMVWSSSELSVYQDGTLRDTCPSLVPAAPCYIWLQEGNAGSMYVDYVLVRAYSATPPAATTFSGEQETASPPVTAFTATPTAGLAPLTVQFTDTSTGGPTSWAWSFGDGNTSTAQNPQHTYTAPGTYTVNLTATNEHGSDDELKTDYITIYGPVTAQFTATPTAGLAPLTVQFTDTSAGSPTTWSWNFGDGNTSTNQNPVHTYTTAGAHTVTLTASHPYSSDTETKTSYITIAVLQPFPGITALPRDLAGTGLYTDINGNNRLDYNDLTVFFQHLVWAKTAQPIACFDFNGNGWLDYNDVITLFTTITGEHP